MSVATNMRADKPGDEIEAVLIAGPTASGKSRLAIQLAQATGGTIVNADSMQVYEGLRILTARPGPDDLAEAAHGLYGHMAPEDAYSAGAYLRDAAPLLDELRREGRLPIFCGGTGLYFEALFGALDAMPDTPDEVRQFWRARLAAEGPLALHALLAQKDPQTAARLAPRDGQRIVRALEIWDAGAGTLSALQAGHGEPLLDPGRCLRILLTPDRAVLRGRIERRFAAMIEAGAMDEVRRFRMMRGAMAGTAGKAIGVAELAAVQDGEVDLPTAMQMAVTRSRRYAKRQETWFRNRFDAGWRRVSTADPDIADIGPF